MTIDELNAIEARANAATEGPWWWGESDLLSKGPVTCSCEDADHLSKPIIETDGGYYGPCQHDRSFIAHARTDVPALVAEVRRLRALVKAAYREGAVAADPHGCDDAVWAVSDARRALDGAE